MHAHTNAHTGGGEGGGGMAGALSGSTGGAGDSAARLVTVLLTLMDGAGGAGPGEQSAALVKQSGALAFAVFKQAWAMQFI
eukprot:scaffold68371_cov18-Tisochrysis_lutea.AAC.1